MKTGIQLITEERERQIEEEGWTKEHDAEHIDSELAYAAICYAMPPEHRATLGINNHIVHHFWPWNPQWWKPTPENRIRELQKAGALIAAEIDRIQKLQIPKFVKLDDKSGTALRLISNEYYRDAGKWSISFIVDDLRYLKSNCPDLPHIDNLLLIPISEEEWRKSNGVYAPKNI